MFNRLLRSVIAFDSRLRSGIADEEIAALSGVLDRLRDNVAGPKSEEVTR